MSKKPHHPPGALIVTACRTCRAMFYYRETCPRCSTVQPPPIHRGRENARNHLPAVSRNVITLQLKESIAAPGAPGPAVAQVLDLGEPLDHPSPSPSL